jgi:hypothetical protein
MTGAKLDKSHFHAIEAAKILGQAAEGRFI